MYNFSNLDLNFYTCKRNIAQKKSHFITCDFYIFSDPHKAKSLNEMAFGKTSHVNNRRSTIKNMTIWVRQHDDDWRIWTCKRGKQISESPCVEVGACWTSTSRVSFLQFTALTSLIWVTWGNGLMTVSWVCFNTMWVGGLSILDWAGTVLWCTVL